ncbi:glycosyltransferase family 2 protein [Flavisolibacter ginsenosidimutans]|uniref:Glycosyltransferase n=1 Tax=Flavisolibacter ginsenosidimutans TaxID=661481 RepID=A0A5B8UJA1_9BACT|nr:glycosyltransferase [Flavisolibacter ginsenosidimutans]QEC56476.1 glycosyltransferase [Flavisolibacter ginsenosidimutans]
MPFLSIIIPTKNRQYTCLFAIESALRLNRDDVEIIVQDCSDTDVLKKQILEKFGTASNIKYFHSADNPSMTENWNRAFDNATGEYQCAIGDDDAVLPELYEAARWAKANAMDAIAHTGDSAAYSYKWPDFGDEELRGKLVILHPFDGKVEERSTKKVIDSIIDRVDLSYSSLPMAYHCLISKALLDRVRTATGKLLDGTSLDVYSAYVFSLLIDKFVFVNYPLTIYGACGKSNTNRLSRGNAKAHFNEFKTLRFPAIIPRVFNMQTTVAESMHCAFTTMKRQDLIERINLPYLYAYSAAEGVQELKATLRCMLANKVKLNVWARFAKTFSIKMAKNFVRFCMGNAWADKQYRNKQQVLVPCNNILEVIEYHKTHNQVKIFQGKQEIPASHLS